MGLTKIALITIGVVLSVGAVSGIGVGIASSIKANNQTTSLNTNETKPSSNGMEKPNSDEALSEHKNESNKVKKIDLEEVFKQVDNNAITIFELDESSKPKKDKRYWTKQSFINPIYWCNSPRS